MSELKADNSDGSPDRPRARGMAAGLAWLAKRWGVGEPRRQFADAGRRFPATSPQLQSAAPLVGEHASRLAGAVAADQAKVTEALDLYAESIVSRLNLASVSLAREFRDKGEHLGEHLNARLASTAESAVKSIAKHGEAASLALRKTVDEIDQRLDAHSQRLSRQLESVAAMEAAARAMSERADGAAAAVETRFREASAVIDCWLDQALQRLEAKIDGRLDALAARLHAVDETLDRSWDERREALAAQFAAAAEAAKLAFADGVQAQMPEWLGLVTAAAHQGDLASEKASAAIGDIEATMARRLEAFESSLTERGGALTAKLEAQSLALQSALDRAQSRIAEVQSGVGQSIAAAAVAFGETLENHRATLAQEMSAAVAMLQDQSVEREKAGVEQVATSARAFADGLLAELGGVAGSLATRGDALREEVLARQGEWLAAMENAASQAETRFAKSLRATTESLEALAARVDGGLEQRGRGIANTLAQATQTLMQTLGEGARETRASIERDAIEAAKALDDARQALIGSIATSARSGAETLTTGLSGHQQRLQASVAEAVHTLATAQAGLIHSIERSAAEADSLLARHRTEASRSLEAGAAEAARALAARRDDLLAAVAEATAAVSQTLMQRGEESRQTLLDEAARAAATLAASQGELSGAATRAAQAFAAEFARQQDDLRDAFGGGAERMKREFVTPLSETLARLEAEGAELAGATKTLAEASARERDRLNSLFTREAEALAATLAANAETFQRQFEATLSGADGAFLSRGLDVAQTLAARIDELRTLLQREGPSFLESLDSRRERLSQQVDAASLRSIGDFERKTTGLIGLLTRRGDDLLSAMTAAASESARKVARLVDEVNIEAGRARQGAEGGDSPAAPPASLTYEIHDREPLRHAAEAGSDFAARSTG